MAYLGMRHLQCVQLFLALAVIFTMRGNLSLAIVAMMDNKSANPDFEEYKWSEKTKSMLLSSFVWGYFITPIIGGHLAQKFGGKVVIFWSVLINGILSVLTPLGVHVGDYPLLMIIRILQGLFQGFVHPSVHNVLSNWIPREELGVWGTLCYAGMPSGTVAITSVGGEIATSALGWPGIFYLCGVLALGWCIIWCILGANKPEDFQWISEEEKQLIADAMRPKSEAQLNSRPKKTPWSQILTSLPFLSLVATQCGAAYSLWTMLTQIPSYMKGVHHEDIKRNALLSALPFIAVIVMTFTLSSIDMLLRRKAVPIYIRRKVFNTIGQWVPIIPLIGLGFVKPGQSTLAVALLTLAVGATAGQFLGLIVNHIDLSPNFAAILMGIANCTAQLAGLLAPLVVGFVVTDPQNPQQWQIIFGVVAVIFFIGNLLFLVFGKATPQPWNFEKEESN